MVVLRPLRKGHCSQRVEVVECPRLAASLGLDPSRRFVRKHIGDRHYETYEREVGACGRLELARLSTTQLARFCRVLYSHHDASDADVGPCYVVLTDYCEGGDLRSLIGEGRAGPALDVGVLGRWAFQLAEAVVLLHSRAGLIHLDIKPANSR
jgi:serine/threonine protein kinase